MPEKSQRIALGLVLGIAPLIFLPVGGEFENIPKIGFLHGGIGLLWLLRLGTRRGNAGAWRPGALDLALLAFYATLWLSLISAGNPAYAWPRLLQWTGAGLFYFYTSTLREDPSETVFAAASLSALAVSALGIGQAWFGWDWIPQGQPPASTFANRNMAAHFVALCFPLTIGSAVVTQRAVVRVLAAMSLVCSVVFLVHAASSGAQLAVLVAMAILALPVFAWLLVLWRAASGRRRTALACAVVVLLVLASGAVLTATRVSAGGAGERSGRLRTIYWMNSLAMAADHPTGVGLANFRFVYPLYHRAAELDWSFDDRYAVTRVHNDHLQVLVELGLVGLAAWCAVFVSGAWTLWRLLRHGSGSRRIRGWFAGLGVVVFVIVAFVSFPSERAMPPVLLLVLLGLIARGRTATATVSPPEPTEPNRILRRVLPMLPIVGFVIVSALWVRGALLADLYRDRAVLRANAGEPAVAVDLLRRARRHAPAEPDLPLLAAGVRIDQGHYESALSALDEALVLDPHRPGTHLQRGFCQARLERYEEAEESFRAALRVMPDFVAAHQNLGLIRSRQGRHADAAVHFEQAIRAALERARYAAAQVGEAEVLPLRVQLGREYATLGRLEEAAAQFEKILAIRPELDDVRRVLESLDRGPEAVP